MEEPKYPFVSIIIPVFNDAARLRLCLATLEKQTYPQRNYEVIVIDNGSDKDQDIAPVVAEFGQAKIAQELTPGSYVARNKGIAIAQGEIIAFTDSDCIPASDWLEKGVKHLMTIPNCGMVVGRIEVFFENPNQPTSIELYQSLTAFNQEKRLNKFHGGATANVFTRRDVIERVGVFDSSLKSFGDFEWGKRVFIAGYKQIYASDTLVKHPARSSWKQLKKRTMRISGGIYDYFMNQQDSFIHRNKMFVRLILDDCKLPIKLIMKTFTDLKVQNLRQKIDVSLTVFLVRYISVREKIRLRFGGISQRE